MNTDQDDKDWLRTLKNNQTAALSALTKKLNEVSRSMEKPDNLHLVKMGMEEFEDRFTKYKDCHSDYLSQLSVSEQQPEIKKFEDKELSVVGFRNQAYQWITTIEASLQDSIDRSSIRSKSHISRRSVRTTASSVKSAHLKEKAKVAGLLAQRTLLEKRAKVVKQQAELQAEEDLLKLDGEIEAARAREKVFQEEIISSVDKVLDPETPVFVPIHNVHHEPNVTVPLSPMTPVPESFYRSQQQLAAAMILPHAEVTKFCGDLLEYASFMLAFNDRIVPYTTSDSNRLYFLNQHLEGKPKSLIAGCMFMDASEGYIEAKRLLDKVYGDPYKVSMAYIDKLSKWPQVRGDSSESLHEYALYLVKCNHTMQSLSNMQVLNDSPNLQRVISKLPVYIQNKWLDHVIKLRKQGVCVCFTTLVEFVQNAAESAMDPVFSREALGKVSLFTKAKAHHGSSQNKQKSLAVTVEPSNSANQCTRKCQFCSGHHDIENCFQFLHKRVDERRKFVRDNRLCFSCFGNNHISKKCLNRRQCKICNKRHPTTLHIENFRMFDSNNAIISQTCSQFGSKGQDCVQGQNCVQGQEGTQGEGCTPGQGNTQGQGSVKSSACTIFDTVLQSILPVQLHVKGSDNVVQTYAFYDTGSTGCFIKDNIKDQLNCKGIETTVKLQTMHGTDTVKTFIVNDLVITDIHGNNDVVLPKVFTQSDIPVNHDQIPRYEVLKDWPHLSSVIDKIPLYQPELDIGILIGSNCPTALQPLEVIPTSGYGPFAVRYLHGWTVNGPVHIKVSSNGVSCHRLLVSNVQHVTDCITVESVRKFFELDFSEKDLGSVPEERGLSFEDRKFVKRCQDTIEFKDGHFQLPMPFRDPNVSLPNNKKQAVSRAEWQRRKMKSNEDYRQQYTAFMDKLFDKGYAYKVPEGEVNKSPVWYLPHHAVFHPKKKKIRVVFDCSAKFGGLSLNDVLLQGPNLTNSLTGVLIRFRQESYAFIGDIEAMFFQIKIPPENHDYVRFLWWPNGDINRPLEEFRMAVHIFGAISSPSIANTALKATGDKADEKYDSTVGNTIRHNFYVDDCLKSCADVPTAVKLVKDLISATGEGGFRLTKFVSNSIDILRALPTEDCSVESDKFDLDMENLMTRALGMLWDLKEDSFKFSIALKENPLTRRGLLSTISSLYDPLGLLSPIILPAKKLLQELCQVESLDWDERIPDDLAKRWQHWIQDLHLLEQLSIPRCYKPSGFGNVTNSSLVLFSDASTVGYGVAAYIVLHDGNQVQSSLVMGKSRVSPKRVVTIPRLELTAATVSVKVAQHILKELEFTVDSVVYYTDSTTVLHYIHSNTKRFPVFVANRVRVIRDYSQPEQWRYVSSNDNPADVASRGISVHQLLQYDEWFHGPSFIASDCLFSQEFVYADFDDGESEHVSAVTTSEECHGFTRLIEYYSSWSRLQKAVSIFQQLKSILRGKRKGYATTDAERAIIMYVQQKAFGDEVKALSRELSVSKSSPIYKLDPFLDSEDGLLKVGGRLRKSDIPQSARHPILLPKKHHVTTLLIQHEHELLAHSGRNHVLSNLRQKYWIINANATVRSVLFHCVTCRKLKEPPLSQKMADLPADRLEPSPPFSNVGIDFFGPYYIKEGRKELKRYGVIFTCLVSRSVHIETANTLQSDSFINALRRFVSRRGHPKVIRCDNGTNFHGAEKELKAALGEMEEKKIETYLLHHHIEWKFNPPAASHMGGCWERQIRTVRKVLSALLKEFGERLNDESLRTLLCEVESIINSRPLTTVSDSVDDLEPLTPNHLLIPKSYVVPPPGLFQKDDVYMRRRWRCVQYLTNLFWSRFRKEYLSTLQTRQKWNEPKRNLIVGDVVLVKSDIEPRNRWPMGRVIEVHPDDKGTIRSAKVKTLSSVIVRPIQKLVLLVKG